MFSSDEIEGQNNNTPLKAGESVPLELVSVAKGDKSEINFNFKGTDKDNSGVFKYVAFAIDRDHPSYTEDNEKRALARILHIGSRFAPEDVVRKAFKGTDWNNYADNVIAFLKDKIKGVQLKGKITIRESVGNDGKPKVFNQFPAFPNFLSSDKYPAAFTTNPLYDKYVPSSEKITDKPDDLTSGDGNLPF